MRAVSRRVHSKAPRLTRPDPCRDSMIICSEPSSTRRAKAQLAGAQHLLSPLETDVVARVKELTGADGGVDVAFEAAGNERALEAGIKALKTRGTLLNVAVWSKDPKVRLGRSSRLTTR